MRKLTWFSVPRVLWGLSVASCVHLFRLAAEPLFVAKFLIFLSYLVLIVYVS